MKNANQRAVQAPTISELERRLKVETVLSLAVPSEDCKELLQSLLSTPVKGECLLENIVHQVPPRRLKESVFYDPRESRRAA